MAILTPEQMNKLVSEQGQKTVPQKKTEGWLPWTARMGTVAAERGLEAALTTPAIGGIVAQKLTPRAHLELEQLEGLPEESQKLGREYIRNLKPIETQEVPLQIREKISQYLPQDFLKTGEGPGYDFFERVSSDLPWVVSGIATGAGAVPALTGSAIRALGGQLGQKVGGPVGDFVGSLFASGLYDILRNITPNKVVPFLESRIEDLYAASKEAASGITASTGHIESVLEKIMTRLHGPASKLTKTARENLQGEFGVMYNIMKGNKINLGDAIEQVQHYNSLLGQEKNKIARSYYKQVIGALNKTIDEEARKQSPQLFKNYQQAKSTWQLLKDSGLSSETFKEAVTKSPTKFKSKTVNKLLAGAKDIPLIFGDVKRFFIPQAAPLFAKSPIAREKLYDAIRDSLGGNVSGVIRNLHSLDRAMTKLESRPSQRNNNILAPGTF